MNCVFSSVKNSRKEPILKLISDISAFERVDLSKISFIPYDAGHNLDEDSWFHIDKFSNQDYFPEYLKEFIPHDYNDIKKEQFSDIKYISSHQEEDFYYQKITPRQYVGRKCFWWLGDAAKLLKLENTLLINDQPDAIYLKAKDSLIFKRIEPLFSVFSGIETLYKEATKEEVDEFLNKDFLVSCIDDKIVHKTSRKRIAAILIKLNEITLSDKSKIIDYIKGYCQDLKIEESTGKIIINDNDDIKMVYFGLHERFYTTPISNEKRLANSVLTIPPPVIA